jgi:hypothetical protein
MKCQNCGLENPNSVNARYYDIAREDSIFYKNLAYALAGRLAKITGSTPDNIILGVVDADKLTNKE